MEIFNFHNHSYEENVVVEKIIIKEKLGTKTELINPTPGELLFKVKNLQKELREAELELEETNTALKKDPLTDARGILVQPMYNRRRRK